MTKDYYERIPAMDKVETIDRYNTISSARQWGRTAARLNWGLTSLTDEVQRWVEVSGKRIDLHSVAIESFNQASKRLKKCS